MQERGGLCHPTHPFHYPVDLLLRVEEVQGDPDAGREAHRAGHYPVLVPEVENGYPGVHSINGEGDQARGTPLLQGRRPPRWRYGLRSLSMVDGLIRHNCPFTSASNPTSPWSSSTLTSSGRKGCNLWEHIRSLASHTTFKAEVVSNPYVRCRPRVRPEGSLCPLLRSLMRREDLNTGDLLEGVLHRCGEVEVAAFDLAHTNLLDEPDGF